MVFDLYSVFHQIILNAKHGFLFTPAHCTKQRKQCRGDRGTMVTFLSEADNYKSFVSKAVQLSGM